jgi:hypothetical protein
VRKRSPLRAFGSARSVPQSYNDWSNKALGMRLSAYDLIATPARISRSGPSAMVESYVSCKSSARGPGDAFTRRFDRLKIQGSGAPMPGTFALLRSQLFAQRVKVWRRRSHRDLVCDVRQMLTRSPSLVFGRPLVPSGSSGGPCDSEVRSRSRHVALGPSSLDLRAPAS